MYDKCLCGRDKDTRAKLCRNCYETNPESKLCCKCNKILPASEFGLRRKGTILRPACKKCEALYAKKRRKLLPEITKAAKDKWYKAGGPLVIKMGIKNAARRMGLNANYIYVEYCKHNGLCDICGKPGSQRLSIDHCHTTGEFRGFLCTNCNNGLGRFKDNIEFLEAAINYLKKSIS